jgi:hypothetical protein
LSFQPLAVWTASTASIVSHLFIHNGFETSSRYVDPSSDASSGAGGVAYASLHTSTVRGFALVFMSPRKCSTAVSMSSPRFNASGSWRACRSWKHVARSSVT